MAEPAGASSRRRAAIAIVLCAAAAAVAGVAARIGTRQPLLATVGPPSGPELRIHAGSEMYADPLGRIWLSDRFVTGGTTGKAASQVKGVRDPQICAAYREGSFRYDIPLAPGVYEMRLYFFEPVTAEGGGPAGEGTRIIQASMNGSPLLRDVDIFAEVGAMAASVKAFKDVSPAADGKLHLDFRGTGRGAVLSAIEITPGIPGVAVPIRMVSRDTPYTDPRGITWSPDDFVTGGKLVFRTQRIQAPDDPEIYRGERFGTLTYRVPVPRGRYAVILRFAETWFGPGHPGGGGPNSRLFDILCNGAWLERSIDIFREAGGSDRGLRKVYRNVEPNAQGAIILTLAPKQNYAEVNAIEILDEAR